MMQVKMVIQSLLNSFVNFVFGFMSLIINGDRPPARIPPVRNPIIFESASSLARKIRSRQVRQNLKIYFFYSVPHFFLFQIRQEALFIKKKNSLKAENSKILPKICFAKQERSRIPVTDCTCNMVFWLATIFW